MLLFLLLRYVVLYRYFCVFVSFVLRKLIYSCVVLCCVVLCCVVALCCCVVLCCVVLCCVVLLMKVY